MAVRKSLRQPIRPRPASAMVIGGGIGGMRAALDLAEAGLKVYLVEQTPCLGGRVAQLGFMFPQHDCVMLRHSRSWLWLYPPFDFPGLSKQLSKLEWLLGQYGGIFRAVILVDGLMVRSTPSDPQVLAHCRCEPPHTIQLKRSLVQKKEVICDSCKQSYEVIEVQS